MSIGIAHTVAAQTQPTPSFAVATVKPVDPNRDDNSTEIGYDNVSFTSRNLSLNDVIKFAWHLSSTGDQQVIGYPGWVDSAKFNIVAKPDPETVAQLNKLPDKQQDAQVEKMVQALLVERFRLQLHHQTRVLPVYDLVLAKGGSKLVPSKLPDSSPDAGSMQFGQGFLKGQACSMDSLAMGLQTVPELGRRLIFDKTGLTGDYDLTLRWAPDPTAGIDSPADAGIPRDPALPSFFTALQEQLGLKLVPSKGPVDILVIDHAEMPSQN